jgi:Tfp pilus assembly protein PilF
MQIKHASFALAALLTAACNSTPNGPDPEQQLKLHREFAQTYFEANQLVQAEQQADLGLALDPRDDGLLLIKAWTHQKRGTADDVLYAEKLFRDLGDEDYRATLGLAEALERKGVLYWESADAVAAGKRATKATDRAKRAAEMRVEAQGFWEESTSVYEHTLELKSGSIQAMNGLQRVCALRGDLAKSLEWSNALLAQSAKEIDFWRNELKRADLRASEEAEFRRMLAGSSRLLIESHLQASTALVGLGRKEDALPHLDLALDMAPEKADVYCRRAQLQHELGRFAPARDDLKLFLKLSSLPIDLLAQCERALSGVSAAKH